MTDGSDKRLDTRVPSKVPVRLKFGGADEFLRLYTENISLGGVFVGTTAEVPLGTRVDLTVELSAGRGMQVEAEVAWRRPASPGVAAGVGLRFISMRPEYQRWLTQAVEKYVKEHGQADGIRQGDHQLRAAQSATEIGTGAMDLVETSMPADGLVVGIDLGTATCSVSAFVDGEVRVLDLQDDDDPLARYRSIPSVVSFDDTGQATVGRRALEQLDRNARRTVFGAKRFIGRNYEAPDVQQMLSRFPYKIVRGPQGRVAVDINGKAMALTAISARILAYLKSRAEAALGKPVGAAIVTVPAFYSDNQRQAVIQAAQLAGLRVLRVLNEPTAAAVAYGLAQVSPRRLLIYDLGGGTFDVSIMEVRSDRLTVLATAGDTFLGGEDFDAAIVELIDQKLQAARGTGLSQNHVALVRVKLAAEAAKRRLSIHPKTTLTVREAVLADGSTTRLELELQRAEVEARVGGLVDRTLRICDIAMEAAGLLPKDLADVLLVGGQTLMPLVQARVASHFSRTPRYDLSPDDVVALGAGMLAHLPKDAGQRFGDVLSMSIGVAVAGRFKKVIKRNTPVPHRDHYDITVPAARLKNYQVDIWQGEYDELHRNEHLGELRVTSLNPSGADPVPLRVEFILSPDCLLKVQVVHGITGESEDVLLDTRDMGG